MKELTPEQFESLKDLYLQKEAELKVLEKETAFLRERFREHLKFSDVKMGWGKNHLAIFKVVNNFKITPPTDVTKKGELYTYLHTHHRDWYRKNVKVDWTPLNKLANQEITKLANKKIDWTPWPHCNWEEETELKVRLRPGALKNMYSKHVKEFGFDSL